MVFSAAGIFMDETQNIQILAVAACDRAKTALQRGDLLTAETEARGALALIPDDLDALYLLAVAQRYGRRYDDALETLHSLSMRHPGYGRAEQEKGHVMLAVGRRDEAREAFSRAVTANPALLASWKALADLYAGEPDDQARAREEVEYLQELHPALLSVASMIYEDKLALAEQLCRRFLQANPTHVEGMRMLADIGTRLNIYDDAEFLLESALEIDPDHTLARLDYVNVLHKRQKYDAAHREAKRLHDIAPEHPLFRSILANESAAIGMFDDALALYDGISRDGLGSAANDLVRGHVLKTIGRQDQAVTAYQAACTAQPNFGDAWWSLANLKTYKFVDVEISTMETAVAGPDASEDDKAHLYFALGKAYEDRGDAETAFRKYAEGNAIRRRQTRYDPDAMALAFQAQKQIFTPDFVAARSGWGDPSDEPIFIVGLPRAGSTLVEQILASHPLVDGTLELPNILALSHRLNGRRRNDEEALYPNCLADLTAENFALFGQEYLRDTRIHRSGAPRFTDKMPNNFRHLGLIHLLFPNARVIDARRDATDCCFSAWKQLFAEGQEFTYGLTDVARYYRGYEDLMDHWTKVLPGMVLRVQYEETVDDLENQVRRILDHCGLPFDEACLNFHMTERAVRTASSEQVRQPIYRSGMEQWRRFEPWLGELTEGLRST